MRSAQEAQANKEEARVLDLKGDAVCSEHNCLLRYAISNKQKEKKIGIRTRREHKYRGGKTGGLF